jgi:hypothetical protein
MIRKLLKIILAFAFLLLPLHPEIIFAEMKQVQLNIRAEVKNLSKLELDSMMITFDVGSLSPDDTPKINSTPGQVMISCKARTGANSNVNLTILASGDLLSGPDRISVNNISWSAAGSGFTGGMLNKTSPQSVGNWIGSGARTGAVSFDLINRWEYAKGEYGTTALFTLTVP